jgi:hypothetical protein
MAKADACFDDIDADEVVAGLFVGSLDAALDETWIRAVHISTVVNVSGSSYNPLPGICYLHVPMRDDNDAPLLPAFTAAWPVVFDALTRKKRVLVHCKLGRSRSAAIAMMVLMRWLSSSLREAYDAVRAARPLVRVPLLGFQLQLTQFERREFGCKSNTIEDWAGAVAADAEGARQLRSKKRRTAEV